MKYFLFKILKMKFQIIILILLTIANRGFSNNFNENNELFITANTQKKHFRQREKTSDTKRYLLIQKGGFAEFKPSKKDLNKYKLIIKNLNPHVIFYKIQPNKNFGLLSMRQYMWYIFFGRSAFNRTYRGALGYLSFKMDNDSKDQLHSGTFQLNKPTYVKKENKFIYDVHLISNQKIPTGNMQEVTLVIDLAVN